MNPPPPQCVIDANLLVRTMIFEDYTRDILAFVARFGQDVEAYAPSWIYLECANALKRAIIAKRYPAAQAVQDIKDLFFLDLHCSPLETLVLPAMALAARYGISAYDGCYAALADRLKLPVLTGDQRMINSLAAAGISFIALAEVFSP
jgi:predicted nucleic acid-binding protein